MKYADGTEVVLPKFIGSTNGKGFRCKASIAEITGIAALTVGKDWSILREVRDERPTVNHSRWLASFNAKCRNEEKKLASEKKKSRGNT